MAFAKNDYEYRYREMVNGVLQAWTGWAALTDANSTLVDGYVQIQVGNKNIPAPYLEVRLSANAGAGRPQPGPSRVITSSFTPAQENTGGKVKAVQVTGTTTKTLTITNADDSTVQTTFTDESESSNTVARPYVQNGVFATGDYVYQDGLTVRVGAVSGGVLNSSKPNLHEAVQDYYADSLLQLTNGAYHTVPLEIVSLAPSRTQRVSEFQNVFFGDHESCEYILLIQDSPNSPFIEFFTRARAGNEGRLIEFLPQRLVVQVEAENFGAISWSTLSIANSSEIPALPEWPGHPYTVEYNFVYNPTLEMMEYIRPMGSTTGGSEIPMQIGVTGQASVVANNGNNLKSITRDVILPNSNISATEKVEANYAESGSGGMAQKTVNGKNLFTDLNDNTNAQALNEADHSAQRAISVTWGKYEGSNWQDRVLSLILEAKETGSRIAFKLFSDDNDTVKEQLFEIREDGLYLNGSPLGGGTSVTISQTTGQSTTEVMSQKAVTDAINAGSTNTQLLFEYPAGSLNTITTLISPGKAATYQSATSSNTATIAYEKNGGATTLPITLATNDTLKVTITRTDAAQAAYVRLNTIAV